MLEVKLGREGSVHVPVSRALKSIEQKILAAPEGPISWRIPVNLGVLGTSTGDVNGWPIGSTADRFLGARSRYFEALRCGASELITQGIDASAHADLVSEYAEAYLELLADLMRRAEATAKSNSQSAFSDLRKVLALDRCTSSLSISVAAVATRSWLLLRTRSEHFGSPRGQSSAPAGLQRHGSRRANT